MAIKVSTAMRNHLLITESLHDILDLGFIRIYSGTPPGTADAALGSAGTNVELVEISNNDTGVGLTFAATASDGAIVKNSAETWSGTAGATNTATFYRHVAVGDTGANSTTESRLQGTVGLAGEDMNLSDTTITSTELQTISSYSVSLPAE